MATPPPSHRTLAIATAATTGLILLAAASFGLWHLIPRIIDAVRDAAPHLQRPSHLAPLLSLCVACYAVGTAAWCSASSLLATRPEPFQQLLVNRRERAIRTMLWFLKIAAVLLWLAAGIAALVLVLSAAASTGALVVGWLAVIALAAVHERYVAGPLGNGFWSNRPTPSPRPSPGARLASDPPPNR